MTPVSTVAVTGATGFVGRAVVKELLARGYAVRALVRDEAKAQAVLPSDAGLSTVPGDVTSQSDLTRLLTGCQAVIHLVGIIREVRRAGKPAATFQGMHVGATSAVINAARSAGIDRFLHMSAIGVAPDGQAEYSRTKFDGEMLVRHSGLAWTVFRPGLIHGPEGELVQTIGKLASSGTPPFFVLPYFVRLVDHEEGVHLPRLTLEPAILAPVYVDDVATLFCEALSRPDTIGEVYNVAGPDPLNWREFTELLRDTLPGCDKSLPTIPVPGTHAAAIATVAKHTGLGSLLPFDAGQAQMATLDTDADLHKLRAHFGIEPRPFVATLRAYAGQMASFA